MYARFMYPLRMANFLVASLLVSGDPAIAAAEVKSEA